MRSAKAKSSKVILLAFPKKIWQISHFPPGQEPAFIDEYRMRWAQTHPNYQYECLNESTEDAFVQKAFSNYRDIRQTYNFIKQDPILRADFLRYLILLAEGGVYTDVDTQPIRPIEDWVHPEFLNRTNVVLGIEADQALGPLWKAFRRTSDYY
ncbi:Initiation-specific alpha-1,6-mannosyltransferase [Neofusicoccum parvum]|nr:Initiation-specific alpha-1,6-mannosyltransferase [Neofusicoccum parvum]